MNNVEKIANEAIMIVNGYAFLECELGYSVTNLHKEGKSVVLSTNGEILESSMDYIEEQIVLDYFNRNKSLLEDKE